MEGLKKFFFVFLELLLGTSKKRHFRLEIALLAVLVQRQGKVIARSVKADAISFDWHRV